MTQMQPTFGGIGIPLRETGPDTSPTDDFISLSAYDIHSLNPGEVRAIMDWISTYGFNPSDVTHLSQYRSTGTVTVTKLVRDHNGTAQFLPGERRPWTQEVRIFNAAPILRRA